MSKIAQQLDSGEPRPDRSHPPLGGCQGHGPSSGVRGAPVTCPGSSSSRETPGTPFPIVGEVLSGHLDAVLGLRPHSLEGEGCGFNWPHLRAEARLGQWERGYSVIKPSVPLLRLLLWHSGTNVHPKQYALCGPLHAFGHLQHLAEQGKTTPPGSGSSWSTRSVPFIYKPTHPESTAPPIPLSITYSCSQLE